MFRQLCTALLAAGALSAHAAAPLARTNAPGFHRIMLGDFEITALSDGTIELPMNQLLKQPAAQTDRELAHAFLKSPLETSVNAYLINTGDKLILVDAGAGALFGPTLGKLAANLKASGYQPEQIDDIYLTHLHPDHLGGLAANSVAVFPNAVVHADRRDAEFWLSKEKMDQAPADSKGFFQGAMTSLQPYTSSQHFQPFDGDTELAPGLKSSATYGHTPGHTVYLVQSRGQKLLLAGDLLHVSAVQFDHPKVTIGFDSDTDAARAQRLKTFSQAAKDGVLLGVSHIQFPGLGHVTVNGQGYRWIPLNYTQLH